MAKDVFKIRILRGGTYLIQVGPKCKYSYPHKREGEGDSALDTQKRKRQCTVEGEVGVIYSEIKELLEPPEVEVEESRNCLCEPLKGAKS